MTMDRFQIGDLVTRDGTDVHRVIEVTDCGVAITVVCVKPPDGGWCEVGETEFNMAGRYVYAGDLIDGDAFSPLELPR